MIKEIVQAIEAGLPRREAIRQYGMARSTLSDWMWGYGSPSYQVRKSGHLTATQRRSMIRAIQEGRMSIEEAKIAYNISLGSTTKKWLRDAQRENAELAGSNFMDMDNDQLPSAQPAVEDPEKQALQQALKKQS